MEGWRDGQSERAEGRGFGSVSQGSDGLVEESCDIFLLVAMCGTEYHHSILETKKQRERDRSISRHSFTLSCAQTILVFNSIVIVKRIYNGYWQYGHRKLLKTDLMCFCAPHLDRQRIEVIKHDMIGLWKQGWVTL